MIDSEWLKCFNADYLYQSCLILFTLKDIQKMSKQILSIQVSTQDWRNNAIQDLRKLRIKLQYSKIYKYESFSESEQSTEKWSRNKKWVFQIFPYQAFNRRSKCKIWIEDY